MNQLSLSLVFLFTSTTQLFSLRAMDERPVKLSDHDQVHVITELLCCLKFNDTPSDIDPLLVKPLICLNVDQFCGTKLDTSSPEKLCISLIAICNIFPEWNFVKIEEVLAALLTNQLAQQKISLLTLIDVAKDSVLHKIMNRTDVSVRAISIICLAAGEEGAPKLVMLCNNTGSTALHYAVSKQKVAIAKTLMSTPGLEIKKLIMMANNAGSTALHNAVLQNKTEFIRWFIKTLNTDFPELAQMKDTLDLSAFDYAKNYHHKINTQLLEPYMS